MEDSYVHILFQGGEECLAVVPYGIMAQKYTEQYFCVPFTRQIENHVLLNLIINEKLKV